VQRTRDQFLAGTGFAENADAGFAGGDAVHVRHHLLHRFAGPDDFVFAEALTKLAVFGFQALQLERVFDGEQKLVGRDGLVDVVIDRITP